MTSVLIAIAILLCAWQAVRSRRLLISALWLAGTSAAVALLMFMLGAPEIAAIELSVGAGLVTVLFVFAINIAGEDPLPIQTLIPRPVAWLLVIAPVGLFAWLGWRLVTPLPGPLEPDTFANAVWNRRGLDILLQIVLVFGGVLGVLGLLAEGKPHAQEEKRS